MRPVLGFIDVPEKKKKAHFNSNTSFLFPKKKTVQDTTRRIRMGGRTRPIAMIVEIRHSSSLVLLCLGSSEICGYCGKYDETAFSMMRSGMRACNSLNLDGPNCVQEIAFSSINIAPLEPYPPSFRQQVCPTPPIP